MGPYQRHRDTLILTLRPISTTTLLNINAKSKLRRKVLLFQSCLFCQATLTLTLTVEALTLSPDPKLSNLVNSPVAASSLPPRENLPLCRDGDERGRWCRGSCKADGKMHHPTWVDAYEWQPYRCRWKSYSPLEARTWYQTRVISASPSALMSHPSSESPSFPIIP